MSSMYCGGHGETLPCSQCEANRQKANAPVAWMYSLWFDDECANRTVSLDRLKLPFGRPSIDYSESGTIEEVALYPAKSAA